MVSDSSQNQILVEHFMKAVILVNICALLGPRFIEFSGRKIHDQGIQSGA